MSEIIVPPVADDNQARENTPLFDHYQTIRVKGAYKEVRDLQNDGFDARIIRRPEDPIFSSLSLAQQSRRKEVQELAMSLNEVALEHIGFSEQSPDFPTAKQFKLASKDPVIRELGSKLTHVSPVAEIWTKRMAHTSFGLLPVYSPPGIVSDASNTIYSPGHFEGEAFSLFDERRGRIEAIEVEKDDLAIDHWLHLSDPIEVRRRGQQATSDIVSEILDTEMYPDGSTVNIGGIACGAAYADLAAIEEIFSIRPDIGINFDLIDIDRGALELATIALNNSMILEVKEEPSEFSNGINGYKNRVARSNDGRVRARLIVANITESSDLQKIADDVQGYHINEGYGTHEYMNSITDQGHEMYFLSAYNFLQNMADMVRPGGKASTAHMTNSHNLLEIISLVEWSDLKPKSIKKLADVLTSTAQPDDSINLRVFDSLSYAFLDLRKAQ